MGQKRALFEKCWVEFCNQYEKARTENRKRPVSDELQKDYARIWLQKSYFTEWDIVFELAQICLREFGREWIHINTPIDKMFFKNYHAERRERKYIDIDIIDPAKYANGVKLQTATHDIFVEVKWISQGMWDVGIKRRVEGVFLDYKKLVSQVRENRCEMGYVCVVDDESSKSELSKKKVTWPTSPRVKILIY